MRALIFDFDGTIANTLPIVLSQTARISQKYKLNKEAQEILKLASQLPLWQLLRELNISWIKKFFILWDVKQAQEQLSTEIEYIEPFHGMKEVLTELANRRIKLYIYSSNIQKIVVKFLEKEKIINLFEKIYTGGSLFGKAKGLTKILKKENLTNTEVLYVADEIRDLIACRKANIKMIGVAWGLAGEQTLVQAHADFIVRNPIEILEII